MAKHTKDGYFLLKLADGETLDDLSHRFGINRDELYALNGNIDPPVARVPYPTAAMLHVVGEREHLYDVLRRYAMSIPMFKRLNPDKDPFALAEGDCIFVRDCTMNGKMESYTLRENDTFESVAQAHGLDAASLISLNPHLYPGDYAQGVTVFISEGQKP